MEFAKVLHVGDVEKIPIQIKRKLPVVSVVVGVKRVEKVIKAMKML